MKRREDEKWEVTGSAQLGLVGAVVEAFGLLRTHLRVIEGMTAEQELIEARALHQHLTQRLIMGLRSSLGRPATAELLASHYSRAKKGTALTVPTKTSLTKRSRRSSGWSARQLKLFEEQPEKPRTPSKNLPMD